MALPFTTGLAAWYDASQISGVADGASLTSWPDLSGNGITLSTARTVYPTFYKTTSAFLVNGLPSVLMGASAGIGTASLGGIGISAQPDTVFLVFKLSGLVSGNSRVYDCAGGSRQLFEADSTNQYGLFAGANATGGTTALGVHYVTAIYNGASSVMRVDGVNITLSGSPGTNNVTGPLLGGGSLNGQICEAALFSGALSSANYGSIESYLAAKWVSSAAPVNANFLSVLGA